MENQENTHKRRVRYSGTHPKTYKEKYKEHNPEKYVDTIEKVIQKGSTPAGMHISIMVKEIIEFLRIKPGQTGLDATLGYGGHTKEMLKCLNGEGHIYALDVDPIESAKTKERLEKQGFGEDILTVRLQNFADIDLVSKETGKKFDFILADLGVSSMQIDNPDRGFSYKVDGPLDLRMNPQRGESAAERLQKVSYEELVGMFVENSDEPYAEEIAKTVMNWRKKGKRIETTTQFKEVIEEALRVVPMSERKEIVKKSCQRCFQALRIDVNSEFEVLYSFLEKLPEVLAPNGRVAILTFHSGEDRLVKRSFKELQKAGIYSDVSKDVIRPSAEECARNGRAKSTKMRWAIRAGEELADRFDFRSIHADEADEAVVIEQICFPPHEACSEKHMKERIAKAPNLFFVAVDKQTGKMAGFLNGLSTNETSFRDEFFTDADLYDPSGKNVMLLGLDVLPEYRRQGLATEIVRQYSEREKENGRKKLILTCLPSKVEMYKKMGFVDEGIADSSWGGEEWHEMSLELIHMKGTIGQ